MKKRGYIHRTAAAIQKGLVSPGQIVNCQIQHDLTCKINSGGECNCYPDILVSRADGLFEIDHKGRLRRTKLQWGNDNPMSSFAPHRAANN